MHEGSSNGDCPLLQKSVIPKAHQLKIQLIRKANGPRAHLSERTLVRNLLLKLKEIQIDRISHPLREMYQTDS